ncbi:hypothetical protein [Variovorax sp. IB41]|uniref:hypothetical protein n=1 Tax=Variovorax sp. IB41 TaxID=2779370 RepID=UPI001E3A9517|nr:hypothetical protein [Variovorax sp. IB41]
MAQAGGGGGGGSGSGGGGPGLNSPDSSAMQQKPTTGGTGPTNPNGTMTAPSAQGNSSAEGNLSGRAKSSGGAMKSERKSDKRGAAGNTQGTGQAQTPSPQ